MITSRKNVNKNDTMQTISRKVKKKVFCGPVDEKMAFILRNQIKINTNSREFCYSARRTVKRM